MYDYVCIYIYMYIHVYTCLCIYIYTHIYAHVFGVKPQYFSLVDQLEDGALDRPQSGVKKVQ